MKNKQPLRTLISLTEKTKELSNEGFLFLKKTPKYKLLAGTAMLFIPGSFTTMTAYRLGRRIIKSYKYFKEDEKNQHINFVRWLSCKSHMKVKSKIHMIKKMKLKKPKLSTNKSNKSHINQTDNFISLNLSQSTNNTPTPIVLEDVLNKIENQENNQTIISTISTEKKSKCRM